MTKNLKTIKLSYHGDQLDTVSAHNASIHIEDLGQGISISIETETESILIDARIPRRRWAFWHRWFSLWHPILEVFE